MIGSSGVAEPELITRRRNLSRRRGIGERSSSPGSEESASSIQQQRWISIAQAIARQSSSRGEENQEEQDDIHDLMVQALRNADSQAESKSTTVDPYRIIKLYFSLFLFRSLNGIFVNTWFDPDETWQSLEVAHHAVFGNGALTWEWRAGIRGAAHPMIFVALFHIIKVLGLEHTHLLISGPRILQAAFSAWTDLYTFLFAFRTFGLESAQLTLTCMIFSWFNFYCGSRTYSNSLEACMTMVALYYWPSPRSPPTSRREFRIALIFAAIGCIVRPTNAIIWIFMGISLLRTYPHRIRSIIFDTIVTGLFALTISLCMDRLFYHRWVFTQWEFLRVNVVESISEFYGTHPFHWYFTQGIPLVLFTSLPFCIHGGQSKFLHNYKRQLFWMCCFVAIVLSLQAHKEFRFLLPLVAPMQVYAGRGLHLLGKDDTRRGRKGAKSYLTQCLALLVISNTLMGFYFSRIHKRGVIHVVEWLREEAYKQAVSSVLFLMPCHSTPFYSHIHLDIPMRYISCEPPLGVAKEFRKQYQDETDLLYSAPSAFLETYFSRHVGNKTLPGQRYPAGTVHKVSQQGYAITQYEWPSHLVWYDNPKLASYLKGIMEGSNYQECARFSNGLFHDDDKQLGNVVVSCVSPSTKSF